MTSVNFPPNVNAAAWDDATTFTVTRHVKAPRDLVWKAHTEKARLNEWWGPKGFERIGGELDLRPGGTYHYGMRAPGGQEIWGMFHYLAVREPDTIVFLNNFSDKAGGITRHPFSPYWPLQVLNRLTLQEKDGGTQVTLCGVPYEATEQERKTFLDGHKSMQAGFGGTFDQLEAYLAAQK